MNREKALDRLEEINNNLTLLMREKKAIQDYIQEEENRLKSYNLKNWAYKLKNDEEFMKEHNRERSTKEIARIMNYSERQVQRFLKEKKND
jgi:hypothetical protein